MRTRRWGERAVLVAVSGLAFAAVMLPGQAANAFRADHEASPPQTWLLKLDSAPTFRVFRQNRSDGLRAAKDAARAQKSEISQNQAEVIDDLPEDAEAIYRTHTVLAGIGVAGDLDDKQALEEIPGVTAVFPVAPKQQSNSFAVPLMTAPEAWQSAGATGQGTKIAVVDSGLDYTHSDFGGPGTDAAWQEARANSTQPVDPDLYDPAKFLGGYDLVGDDYDTDPTSDHYQPVPHPDPNPLDCGGHGSHVAGSAAGYGVNADGSTYSGSYSDSIDFGAMKIGPGMAPEAGIVSIRVFGCDGSSNVITEAIDRAADPNGDGDPSDRVDVINLSLGSDFGSIQDGDGVASASAVNLGISVVAAAGNAGDHTDISGSPGDTPQVLSVASSVDAGAVIDGLKVTIDGTPETFGITRSGLYDWAGGADLSGDVVLAPPGNETACDPYAGTPFNGKVVLVKWTDAAIECGSKQRADNLEAAGAIGFIFGNDSESFSVGINGNAGIPGVLVVDSGRVAIRDAIENGLPVTVTGTEINSVTQNFPELVDRVSGFSSRGIHAAGNVKPDVSAVGNTVFSAAVGGATKGTTMSGTSMASPMVAGLAALVHQMNPAWTPLQIKADIMNTAGHDLYVGGSVSPASGRYGAPRVGSGRIDAEAAVKNEVLAYNPENGSVSVSFGPVEASEPLTLSKQVTVDNQAATAKTFDVSFASIHPVPGVDISVSPAQVSLQPGEKKNVTATLVVDDPSELTKSIDPTVGRFTSDGNPRETLAEAFGRIELEPTSPGQDLRVQVYVAPRPASKMKQASPIEIHRDADGAADPVQSAAFALSGEGLGTDPGDNGRGNGDPHDDIQSLAAGFELLAEGDDSPQCSAEIKNACWRLPEEKNADVKLFGFTSDAPYVDDPADALGYFAFATREPFAIPADKAILQVDFDLDGDDVPDLFLYNARLGDDDLFVANLLDPSKPAGQRIVDRQPINARLGDVDTALYDSDVIVLPVSLAVLEEYGFDPAEPRVSVGVESYSGFSKQPIDLIGVDPESGHLADPLSVNLTQPAVTVTDSDGHGPLLADQPGEQLTLKRDVGSWQGDSGQGLMMVHFHNEVGKKAGVVTLHGAPSSTRLKVTGNSLTAEVEATTGGLPQPTGDVVFSVDGDEVGMAQLDGGAATLGFKVPTGAERQVKAEYLGNIDFEGSADQANRVDPRITAWVRSLKGRNSRGWYRTPVKIGFICTIRGAELDGRCPPPVSLGRDMRGGQVVRTIRAQDGGGSTVRVRGINIDRTPPVVRLTGVRRDRTYSRPPRARCRARDRMSGLLKCRVTKRKRGRSVIYVATGTDRAGNHRRVELKIRLNRAG